MIPTPPSNAGAVMLTRRRCDDGSMLSMVGASGVRDGATMRELLAVPDPAAFTARTITV